MSKKQANIAATILEKVARNSVKMAADSRCMYVLHQPKQPAGMKEFRKYIVATRGKYCNICRVEITRGYGSIFLWKILLAGRSSTSSIA